MPSGNASMNKKRNELKIIVYKIKVYDWDFYGFLAFNGVYYFRVLELNVMQKREK